MAPSFPGWLAFGASVRGATHTQRNLPNQDALAWTPPDGHGPPLVLALADGHGEARSFRSHHGARLAVQAACDLGADLAGEALSSAGAESGRRLADRWRQLVEAHRTANPDGWDEAIAGLERAGDRQAPAELHENPLLAYGSTLVFAVVTAEGLWYGQLGDGDILEIAGPTTVRRPLPADPRLVGNLTTSLCQPDCWRDFRFAFRPAAEAPLAVLLATDGYANSFRDPAGFLQVGPDLVDALRNDGLAAVRDLLPGWLEETSREGSGDDISAGLLIRPLVLGVGAAGGEGGGHG
ncbi:MAG: protein phosphatase 2C domain-containing protein [Candidatus Riflebacteria bacterium]|nr:protein phosphatase 2C domain-containing protein [Candidatus Riflebacteria bacterium]